MKIKYFEERIDKFVEDGILPSDFMLHEVSVDAHSNITKAFGYADNGKKGYMWDSKGIGYTNNLIEQYTLVQLEETYAIVSGKMMEPVNEISIG